MKVLVTGAKGMLGRTLVRELGGAFEMIPTDLPEADITNESVIDAVIAHHSPDAVIHCAAMTAVDRCETERDLAFALNARGTANVAAAWRFRRITSSTVRRIGRIVNLIAQPAAIRSTARASLLAKKLCASFVLIM